MKGKISIIIPAWNERAIIHRTLERLKRLDGAGDLEIIVVDGCLNQSTIGAVSLSGIVTATSPKGRGVQMNKGAALASGGVLVFLHADCRLPTEAFVKIMTALAPEDVVAGAFDLGIQSRRKVYRIIEFGVFLRTRLTRVPYGDQALFVKKDFFHHIGGFKNLALMEDVELIRRIKKSGKKVAIIPLKVFSSPRRWEKEGIFRCTLKNWMLISLYFLGVGPERLVKYARR